MRYLLVLLTLITFRSYASTEAKCELTNGIYINSSTHIQDIAFETIVDVFTINNAKAFNIVLDGQKLRFLRTEMDVGKLTKLIYLQKTNDKVLRAIHMMIDRSPKEITATKEFYGNMIISPYDMDFSNIHRTQNLVYNFYCSF